MSDIQTDLRRALRWLTTATVVLYLALTGIGGYVYVVGTSQSQRLVDTAVELHEVATTNHAALCTLRRDLETRVEALREFLEDNPNGIPGLSPVAIRHRIEDLEQTLDALDILECSPVVGA